MAIKLEKTCPKCGSHLIVRDGQYGEFHACPRFPQCKYTEPITGETYAIYKPPSPYCEKCNHTGFLPFIKDGQTISHARIYCECHKDEEHYQPVRPEDFDFPMSYSFYRSLCQYQGWLEPGPDILEEEPRELIPEPQPMRIYLNIDRKSLELQKRIALLEMEADTLKEIKTKKSKQYTKYIP